MARSESAPPNRVRDLRGERGWTQEKLAQRAKVSLYTISRTELGIHTPNVITQVKIARAFGLPRDMVFPDVPASAEASA